jgi:DSF synthase
MPREHGYSSSDSDKHPLSPVPPVTLNSHEASLRDPQALLNTRSVPFGGRQSDIDKAPLFDLKQLDVSWEESTGALWTFMRPRGRPSYNLDLLDDFHAWQRGIVTAFANCPDQLRYVILGSRTPGIFNLGGDLELFVTNIRNRDRASLVAYGKSCVQILYRNINCLGLPMITIGLAQGDALGGGFESLLSFNVIIAERGARFGFPENLFGLFPGMGAYSLVARRVGAALAEEMLLTGHLYTAEEMKDMGLVHVLAEPGQGLTAAQNYIRRNHRRHNGCRGTFAVGREVNPVSLEELERIVEIWADACLQLREWDLKVMQRLVNAQNRHAGDVAARCQTQTPKGLSASTYPRSRSA